MIRSKDELLADDRDDALEQLIARAWSLRVAEVLQCVDVDVGDGELAAGWRQQSSS
jgi:hypothetical protein